MHDSKQCSITTMCAVSFGDHGSDFVQVEPNLQTSILVSVACCLADYIDISDLCWLKTIKDTVFLCISHHVASAIMASKRLCSHVCGTLAMQDRQITEEVRHTFEGIISKKSFPTKGKFYPGCEHGWALRGDDSDHKIREGAADAFSEAVSWFEAHGAK